MNEKIKIIIAGGSGLIGSRLVDYLPRDKFEICILSRREHNSHDNVTYSKWDPDKMEMDDSILNEVDAIVNLAGAGIADKKWTNERKELLVTSRVNSSRTLESYVSKLSKKPKLYFGASGIGMYGHRGDDIMTTDSKRGSGFLADVTEAWEVANKKLEVHFKRHVILRIGIVLSTKGGALKEILKPANAGVYGYFGNGSAYYSWIHIDDICKIIAESINNDAFNGIYNGTAPDPVTIYNLVKTVKAVKNSFGVLMPVPKFGLKIAMGEMADMLFNSTRVIPNRLNAQGFKFDYVELDKALTHLMDSKV